MRNIYVILIILKTTLSGIHMQGLDQNVTAQIDKTDVKNFNLQGITVFNYGYRVYYVIWDRTADWFRAYAYCRDWNMALASPSTELEALFLRNTLIARKLMGSKESRKDYWLSLNDISSRNKYIWMSTGKPLINKGDWIPGEPNHLSSHNDGNTKEVEHCVEISTHYGIVGWNDLRCSEMRRFICEK